MLPFKASETTQAQQTTLTLQIYKDFRNIGKYKHSIMLGPIVLNLWLWYERMGINIYYDLHRNKMRTVIWTDKAKCCWHLFNIQHINYKWNISHASKQLSSIYTYLYLHACTLKAQTKAMTYPLITPTQSLDTHAPTSLSCDLCDPHKF